MESTRAAPATEPTFEDALARLELIVEAMESGEVPLATLLAKFEEGSALLQLCEARLKDAEMKIELLKRQGDALATTAFSVGRDE